MGSIPTCSTILYNSAMIHLIGYWHEGKWNPSKWVHPKYLVDETWDQQERKAIVKYLREGTYHEGYMGRSWCRFYCGHTDMGARELTDGTFFWPEGLSHYVELHSVKLPNQVIDHMLGRKKFEAAYDWGQACSMYPSDFPCEKPIAQIIDRSRPKTPSGYQPQRPQEGWPQRKFK